MSVAGNYEEIAGEVVARTAEVLRAAVSVTDERGIIVASSRRGVRGLPNALADPARARPWLRVPLSCGGHSGEVLVAEPRGGEPVSPRLARALVELTIGQTAVVDQLPNRRDLKNTLIHDLLRGAIGDEAALMREAKILGMDLSPPRAVILIDAADFVLAAAGDEDAATAQRRAERVVASVVRFFKLPNDTICADLGDGEIAVLKASNTKNLESWAKGGGERDEPGASWANLLALKRASAALLARLRADTGAAISIGIGRYHPGLRGLAQSYQDARAALSLGRSSQGRNQVHCLDGLGIAAFVGVADETTKLDLALHLLSPLDHEPELLDTIETFFATDCCPSVTASRLAIHRNTLGYRLAKIAALTGLDPRHFDDAVQIRLALALRALHGPRPAPESAEARDAA